MRGGSRTLVFLCIKDMFEKNLSMFLLPPSPGSVGSEPSERHGRLNGHSEQMPLSANASPRNQTAAKLTLSGAAAGPDCHFDPLPAARQLILLP